MKEPIIILTLSIIIIILFIRCKYWKKETHHISMSFMYAKKFIAAVGMDKEWQKYINRIGD